MEATEHLRSLARRLTDSYLEQTFPEAVLLTGSAASDDADFFSDLDLLLYYEQLPTAESIRRARAAIGPDAVKRESRTGGGHSETFFIGGLQCQLGHVTLAEARKDIDRLVVELEVGPELLKVMSGLVDSVALHGEALVDELRHRATYSDALRRAVIDWHWKRLFPLWYFDAKLAERDALLWRFEVVVDSALSLVAVLAAVSRIYVSTFELKRMRRLLGRLRFAPPRFADRLEALLIAPGDAAQELERLVEETEAIVREHVPGVELELWEPVGYREQPWSPPAELG